MSIKNWTAQLQIAEDRPILNQAKKLADSGNLAAAIDVASQIDPDRALYREAREAIKGWTSQVATLSRRSRGFPFQYGRFGPFSPGPPRLLGDGN